MNAKVMLEMIVCDISSKQGMLLIALTVQERKSYFPIRNDSCKTSQKIMKLHSNKENLQIKPTSSVNDAGLR